MRTVWKARHCACARSAIWDLCDSGRMSIRTSPWTGSPRSQHAAWDAQDFAVIRSTLATSVDRLASAGADFFVCAYNTAHLALEADARRSPCRDCTSPISSPSGPPRHGDTRWAYWRRSTQWTVGRHGIDTVVPDDDDRRTVNDIIFGELVEGVFTEQARSTYAQIIERLKDRGCDAVALVCTEIPLLIDEDSSPLPVLDSTRLLAAAASRWLSGTSRCRPGAAAPGDRMARQLAGAAAPWSSTWVTRVLSQSSKSRSRSGGAPSRSEFSVGLGTESRCTAGL